MSPHFGSHAKPSRNCANCRAVKRRCDKQRPHCGQCIRTHETCRGYRDEWDLVFRDQTNHTIKRSKAKASSPATEGLATSPGASNTPQPINALAPNLDEIGVNYFLHNFIIGGHSPAHGYLNYIPIVYSADGECPTLVASMAAVGLVALANSSRQPELVRHARTKYSEAIHRVNTALSSPVESLKDSTLMSVISLGVFEHVSNLESWARHVRGAAALLVARGKSQFSSTAALLMFNQVRTDLVFACVHDNRPFPQDMWELQDEAMKHVDASNAFWLMGVLATRHVNLLWKVRENNGEIPWTVFLEQVTTLQRDFQHVLGLLAVQEPYTSCPAADSDSDLFHNGHFDMYQSTWAIRVWNNARMAQMVICNIMYYLLSKILSTDLAPQTRAHLNLELRESLQLQAKLAADMLGTVPQGLGLVSPTITGNLLPVDCSSTNASGGFLLTWTLYTAGQSMAVKSKTRQWVVRRLQHIGQYAGNAVALQLLDVIVKVDKIRLKEECDDEAKKMVDVYDLRE
ncbi:hypothetical protein BJX66DRAFT_172821 [Aspergillus keveii]|uniref:Zn(2)-C6 fungal-type domain-containing protein n=1 Tax=Aspergillus keveii TaxID=714993 RepID=A0ABR4G902_9EURO